MAGLRDKASKINFAALMPAGPAVQPESKVPKTAPGAMMAHANDARSDLLKENESLRERAARTDALESELTEAVKDLREWDGAKPARLVEPQRIARSRYANRHASNFVGEDFERFKREILEAGGNVQPIKIRPRVGGKEGDFEFEIVYGHRRHEACLQLGIPVLAVIDNLDDRTLFVEMDRENRERADLSPWEQGVMYLGALEDGLFASNRQLAAALGIDPSNLGKSIALAKLPAAVIAAFPSPLEIQLRWAPLLNKALETDAASVLKRAEGIAAQPERRTSKVVLAHLTGGVGKDAQAPLGEARHFSAYGKRAATLRFDSDGRATLQVQVALDSSQQARLAELTETFVQSL
jgi:ParB family chromosome partitioning protein